MRRLFLIILAIWAVSLAYGQNFSTAGFYALSGTGRSVSCLNPGWRFYKGDIAGSEASTFDDRGWSVVNLPNGIELLPLEASGGVNYRGVVWYRKAITIDGEQLAKRNLIYFEAIMGKSQIWVNGVLVATHLGGFTPIIIDISSYFKGDSENIIAVRADNSDDISYPPGKTQTMLDFCYFGGIYRDVWMVTTSKDCYITDANLAGKVAGGGLFCHYSDVSEKSATIGIKLDVACANIKGGSIDYELMDGNSVVAKWSCGLKSGNNESSVKLRKPKLWSPDSPHLYTLNIIVNNNGRIVDGYSQRIGIKTVKFTAQDGFILNGKPYGRKLIGANRHQDFAIIGNALSNNLHYRDAAKLKAAGMDIIRNAHYPQDPAFMDACDELGLFVIENTPGWQFWNEDPAFEQRVYTDIATIVRRDRNRASVLMWEPILNETWYPETFAANTHNIIKAETPYQGTNYTAADAEARGSSVFDILYSHPGDVKDNVKVYFNREWGDNVDDWNSQNSTSRTARQWGETPQIVQALHYADPSYNVTSYAKLLSAPANVVGGTLWHSFDHQRGYHSAPFYGGIMDAMRCEKYSYQMFRAQSKSVEPMIFVANALTPFSPSDVIVFSNCDVVRLLTPFGDTIRTAWRDDKLWFTFAGAWDFMADKTLSRSGAQSRSVIVAQGLDADGNILCRHAVEPARRAYKIVLTVDTMGVSPIADGGDMFVVRASITDAKGNIKRLNENHIIFSVEGQGELVASGSTLTNPAPVLWGEACAIVRTTTTSGRIKISARPLLTGDHTPLPATIEITTSRSPINLIYDKKLTPTPMGASPATIITPAHNREALENKLKEVEAQQSTFGEGK